MSGRLWRFADLDVDSDVPFSGLTSARGPAEIQIRRDHVADADWARIQTWPAEAGDWLTIDRGPHGYRLRFAGLTCAISADGSSVRYEPAVDLPSELLVHLLLHQVLPLAVSRRGRLVVHACGVATDRGVVGLIGDTGAGKSTLAAACCARGAALVADDALVLELTADATRVWPTADGLRLWDDMLVAVGAEMPPVPASGKRHVPVTLARDTAPLTSLLLVGDAHDTDVVVSDVEPPAARVALLPHLFRLDVGDPLESQRLFDAVHELAQRVPMRRLAFPDGVAHLSRAADTVLSGTRATS